MPIIDNVIPYDDYRILIELKNGQSIILNLEYKLNTIRFGILENKDIFRRVSTDGFSILWDKGKLRVSIGEMMEMLQDIRPMFKVI